MEVLYDDVAVPKSPFRVGVTEGCDPTRVRAFGPGLEGGLVNKANRFTVETRYPPLCLTLTQGHVHLDLCLFALLPSVRGGQGSFLSTSQTAYYSLSFPALGPQQPALFSPSLSPNPFHPFHWL